MTATERLVVADTNIASYLMKGLPIGLEYLQLVSGHEMCVSFVTAGELRYWAERKRWGSRRRLQLDLFLTEFPVVPYSKGMDRVFGNVMAERERAGRRMEHADAWIAATALYHELPLVTHDEDFLHTHGLRVITASEEVRAAQRRLPPVSRAPLSLDMRCRCGM